MKDLMDAHTNICRLKGEIMALHALLASILDTRQPDDLTRIRQSFEENIELAQVMCSNALVGDAVVSGLEEAGTALRALLASAENPANPRWNSH